MEQPEEIVPRFTAAWMERDAAQLASLFAADAEFVNVVGLWWHDREAIEKAHHYGLSTFFAESTLTPGAIRIRRVGSSAAIVQCRFTLTGQIAPDGSIGGARQTILTFVLERQGAIWHCVAAQNTDVVPGAETQLAHRDALRPADYRA
ncbi:conserved hypothetical protein [Poseidonocella pacifica]|uniref:DUF4440 domain-containing protein n=1 Tax=Poseidonocella pacifica TaxID=871651 RepID=A0A1I0WGE9_9RHOB|nr:SgcJ/EcaC family oxidoreductase [Poseidonocella pacifica]SFA87822.1 conserved hypothetical protein [Poseidonocella pacifica]